MKHKTVDRFRKSPTANHARLAYRACVTAYARFIFLISNNNYNLVAGCH